MSTGRGSRDNGKGAWISLLVAALVVTATVPAVDAAGTQPSQDDGSILEWTRVYPGDDATQDEFDNAKVMVHTSITAPETSDGSDTSDWYSTTVDLEQRDSEYFYDFAHYIHSYAEWEGKHPAIVEKKPGIWGSCDGPVTFTLTVPPAVSVAWDWDWCGSWDIDDSGRDSDSSWEWEWQEQMFNTSGGTAGYDWGWNSWGSSAEVQDGKLHGVGIGGAIQRCHDNEDLIPNYCTGSWEGTLDENDNWDKEWFYFKNYQECWVNSDGYVECPDGASTGDGDGSSDGGSGGGTGGGTGGDDCDRTGTVCSNEASVPQLPPLNLSLPEPGSITV